MRFVTNEEDKNKYSEFLQKHERCNFQQSLEWAEIKSDWKKEVILAEDTQENIIGSLCVWIRKIPMFGNLMYASRGPVCDIHNLEALKQLTDGAKELAKKYNAFVLRIEPDILSSDQDFRKIITGLGYRIKDDAKNFREEIQPRYVFRLDLKGKTEDEIFKAFHQKTRYNVRLAIKKGVKVRTGTKEDFKIFYDIMKETGSRDNFFIRQLSYFEKLYECMEPNKHVKLLIAQHEGNPIAAVMPIMYGNKVWYLYGGSSNKYRNLMPNYLLQFEMMKWGLENNCDIYDFRGVSGFKNENDAQYGVYKFKKGFNPEFVEFVNELYIVFNPMMNFIFNVSEKIYKFLGNIKSKLK